MLSSDGVDQDRTSVNVVAATHQRKKLLIMINIDNCLFNLDESLYRLYCEKFGQDKIPSPDAMMEHACSFGSLPIIPRGEQYKLCALLVEENFFGLDNLQLPNAKGILQEIHQYEEKYNTIDFRLFTTLNPLSSSIYFKYIGSEYHGEQVEGKKGYSKPPTLAQDDVSRLMTSKMNWVLKLLGHKRNWMKKIMFLEEDLSHDSSPILNLADIIVQAFPLVSPLNHTEKHQQIFILQGPCNTNFLKKSNAWKQLMTTNNEKNLRTFHRMKGWKDWKKSWNLEFSLNDFLNKFQSTQTADAALSSSKSRDGLNIEIPYYFHGSKDSVDTDKFYVFTEQLPPESDCNLFIRSSGNEDRNLVVIRRDDFTKLTSDMDTGYMADVFKGIPDEANNALFTTYFYHKQKYPCPISGRVRRLIPLKVCQTMLNLLSKVRRCKECRATVIKALNVPSFKLKKFTLELIDFTKMTIDDIGLDDVKYCAFRLGQTLALVTKGCELYTKKDIADFYHDLQPLLYRDETLSHEQKLDTLQRYKNLFLEEIDCAVSQRYSHLNILFLDREKLREKNMNYFYLQCNGFIIDLKDKVMRCLSYGLDDYSVSTTLKKKEKEQNEPSYWTFDDSVYDTYESTDCKEPKDTTIPIQIFISNREQDKVDHPYFASLLDSIYEDEDERNGVPVSEARLSDPKQQLSLKLLQILDTIKQQDNKNSDKKIHALCEQVLLLDFTKYFYVFKFDAQLEKIVDILHMRSKLTNLPVDLSVVDHYRKLILGID
ncbi:hypothetical protein C9374_003422 [Naegleria lovaniensis]|uniref:Uncharacterized protein n=1 Tax=Naegleria lovaniensis TaxID=51637 RepID=A0AA88GRB9_NAELO|nr:uncharacterized protein C9374_003422 [Naegleria lovaniensis]KAG2385607.1 hypothetical protein C9374_003422 [Naegleria lovaniensis]